MLKLVLVLAQATAPRANTSPALGPVLDSVIPALMREHRVPGAALVIVRGDSTVALRGYGEANQATHRPVDPARTVFRIASVAKLFVAATVLQQVERGGLDLRADLRAGFPEIPVRGGGDTPVRLHDLLTHTAGFEERVIGMATTRPEGLRPLGEYLADRMPRRDVAPGTRTSYSNHGYALAGYAVARAAGVEFADYASRELFEPLGMVRTSYRVPRGDPADRAVGYQCDQSACREGPPAYTHTYPAGLAYSTAADMRQFLLAMLGREVSGAAPVLTPTSLAMMQAEQFSHDSTLEGMGYGFWRHRWRTGELVLSHAGNVPGFVALLQLVPGHQVGLFLATNGNSAVFARLASEALLSALVSGPPVDAGAVPGFPGDVREFAGTYRLTRTGRRSLETFPTLFQNPIRLSGAGDTLVVHRTSGPVSFVRTGPLQFRSIDGQHRIAFRRDAGRGIGLLLAGQPAFGGEFPAAYERLAWHDTPHFMNEYVSWLVMLPVLSLLAWGVIGGVGALRRRRGPPAGRVPVPGVVIGLSVLWAAGFLLFGLGFIARSTRLMAGPLVYGLTPGQQLAAQAPWLLGAVAILLVRAAWSGWRERWRWAGLICLTVIAADALAAVASLARWGYLPAQW